MDELTHKRLSAAVRVDWISRNDLKGLKTFLEIQEKKKMKKERVSVIFFSHARSNFLFNIFWLASYPVYGAKREKFLDIGFNPFMHFFWVANCNFIQGPV